MDSKNSIEKIGKYISKRRKELHLTQDYVARELGINNKMISNWENGRTAPDILLLKPLANILKVSVDDILLNKTKVEQVKKKYNYFGLIILLLLMTCFISITGILIFNDVNNNSSNVVQIYDLASADERYYIDGVLIEYDDKLTFFAKNIEIRNDNTIGTKDELKIDFLDITLYSGKELICKKTYTFFDKDEVLRSFLEDYYIVFDTKKSVLFDDLSVEISYENEKIIIPIQILNF